MTREEAIAILQDEAYFLYEDDVPYNRQAFEMAIQALSQEPCDDVVSRDAVIKEIFYSSDNSCDVVLSTELMDRINKLPSVTQKSERYVDGIHAMGYREGYKDAQKQKSGKWVAIDEEPHEVWECDHCGFVIDGSGCIEPYEYRDTYNFCPNCGAKMESEDKE